MLQYILLKFVLFSDIGGIPVEEREYYLRTLSFQSVWDLKKTGQPVVDLTNQMTVDAVVQSLGSYSESPMLWQLLRVLGKQSDFSELREDRFALQDVLFFMDFDRVFLNQPEAPKDAARDVLTNGVLLRLEENGEPRRFVAFDKSNSMARTGRISFLDERYLDEMHRRLMLDMDHVQASLSKVYAYRGLYFSDAARIRLKLDETSVVVLPDDEDNITDGSGSNRMENLFSAETHETDASGYDIWECGTSMQTVELNRFDGEGFIDPETAKVLNAQLGESSSSFQIRMPFAKGMLHAVDFQAFFRSLQGENEGKLIVKDVYGIDRDLSRCRLLLTKSMFKGWKWLKAHCQSIGQPDPMKYYFEKMERFDHGLYISNTDAMLEDPTGRVPLNYQFLNPMQLTDAELTALLDEHFRQADRLKKNKLYQRLALQRANLEALDDAEVCADETLFRREKSAWVQAVQQNPNFLRDGRVTTLLESKRRAEQRAAVTGRLSVKGVCRFLARDLLALMVFAAEKRITLDGKALSEVNPEAFAAAKAACLQTNQIYLPETTLKLRDGFDCAVLRNPHLSRNEECALRAMVPEKDSLYDRYFSHLTGVVMVGYDSLAPMALGGADFDGDLVKVITDLNVVRAVRRGVYDEKRVRALPVISIPSPGGSEKSAAKNVDVDTIADTFSSRVGSISNTAVRLGMKEYAAQPEPDAENRCAECCILTGLEIDASKTGRHPSLADIHQVQDRFYPRGSRTYLDRKDKILGLKIYGKDWKVRAREKDAFVIEDRRRRKSKPLRIERGDGTLDRLLFAYLEQVTETKKAEDEPAISRRRPPLFRSPEAENRLAPDQLETVRAILWACTETIREGNELGRLRRSYANAKYSGRCRTILTLQYGSPENDVSAFFPTLPGEGTAEETMLRIWGKLRAFCETADDAQTLVQALLDQNWIWMTKEDREAFVKAKFSDLFTLTELAMLTRFDQGGYRLLYYMLKDVRTARLQEEKARLEDAPEIEKPQRAQDDSDEQFQRKTERAVQKAVLQKSAASWLEEDRSVLRHLLKNHAEASAWKREVIENCRAQLRRYAPGGVLANLAEPIYTQCRDLDPKRELFWELFRWSDLQEQICAYQSEKEGSRNAQ